MVPRPSNQPSLGLAKLCESVLSAPLDKTCQISDWVRRPLTASQRQYSALDAYVVLYLYDKLTARYCKTMNFDQFELLLQSNKVFKSIKL